MFINSNFVSMARPGGYGSGDGRRGTGSKGSSSCMIRFVIQKRKFGFAMRAAVRPIYGYNVWKHYCQVPVMA